MKRREDHVQKLDRGEEHAVNWTKGRNMLKTGWHGGKCCKLDRREENAVNWKEGRYML